MIIDPADDEINILLPLSFMIFVAIILLIAGTIFSVIYLILKKLKVIEGKLFEKNLILIKSIKERYLSK